MSEQFQPSLDMFVRKPKRRKFRFTATGKLKKCHFCSKDKAFYLCSKCGQAYCSLECYRSETHRECSEHFFKKQVFEHLKHLKSNKEETAKMIEILKRQNGPDYVDLVDYLQDDSEESSNDFGGKDEQFEEFLTLLSTKLTSDNQIDPWFQLSEEQKLQFISLVEQHPRYFDQVIPQWDPWWHREEWRRVVSFVDDVSHENCFPQLFQQIDPMSRLTSKSPSPLIATSIVVTLYAYCHLCHNYNGEVACCAHREPLESLVEFSKWNLEILKELFLLAPQLEPGNHNFDNIEDPVTTFGALVTRHLSIEPYDKAGASELKRYSIKLLEDCLVFTTDLKQPGRSVIVRHDSNLTHHAPKALVLALSDLCHILIRVKSCISKKNKKEGKKVELIFRKVLFYLSYAIEYFDDELAIRLTEALRYHRDKLRQEVLIFEQEEDSEVCKQEPKVQEIL